MTEVMPHYAAVGTNDPERATAFYGELLGTLGWGRIFDNPAGGAFFGHPNTGMFAVVTPYDEKAATIGNGAMAGFALASNAAVDAFYAKALALGGTDEGPPGYRGPEEVGAYFAYFRDPEGNKLCAYHWVMPG
jgi:catechol 2,3-dioxygenase-like lactoylglutathione lyase family enzyme